MIEYPNPPYRLKIEDKRHPARSSLGIVIQKLAIKIRVEDITRAFQEHRISSFSIIDPKCKPQYLRS